MHSLKDERYVKAQDWRCKPCTDEACDKSKPCEHVLAQKGITPELVENLKTSVAKTQEVQAKGFTSCTVEITQADFDALAGFPYDILAPGNYCLAEDITYSPPGPFFPAIFIGSDDVTLDLKGFRIQSDGTANTTGIIVGDFFGPPLKNITIKNGTIQNFTSAGIWSIALSQFFGQGPYESLTFEDLNVLHCGSDANGLPANGINLDSLADFQSSENPPDPSDPANVAFRNVTIKRCKVNYTTQGGGVRVWYGQNVTVEDVEANNSVQNTDNSGNFLTGEFWDNLSGYTFVCNNLSMIRCQANNTRSLEDPSFGQVSGALIFDTKGLFIKDCQFNDTFGNTSFIVSGANLSNCRDVEIINCQFNDVVGGPAVFDIDNVHLSDAPHQETSANGLKFVNCQFNGAKAITDTPEREFFSRGFFCLTTQNIELQGCQAVRRDLSGLNSGTAGFVLATGFFDPASLKYANVQNIVIKDCTAADIHSDFEAIGITVQGVSASRTGEQAKTANVVIDNCVAQNITSTTDNLTTAVVSGISVNQFLPDDVFSGQFPKLENVVIKNCTVMDVHHINNELNQLSSGILVSSVFSPTLCDNIVQNSDRGILFSGTDEVIPNGFQLAATKEDALEQKFIELDVFIGVTVYIPDTDETLGPFEAINAQYSPPNTIPVTAVGGLPQVGNEIACAPITTDLTGKIGVVSRGSCNFTDKTLNVEAAGGIATVVYNNVPGEPFIMGSSIGIPVGTGPSVMISDVDGAIVVAALETYPDAVVSIKTFPGSETHTFTRGPGDSVSVPTDQVDDLNGFENNFVIVDPENMNDLGWKTGDAVVYTSEDPDEPIPGLVSGETYYLIVYRPGFTECGLVQDNKVSNCLFTGYQDDRCPTTSAFINNVALKNGKCHSDNYKIKWPGKMPVCKGDLACYPTDCPKLYNTSLVAARKHHHDCRRCHRKHRC